MKSLIIYIVTTLVVLGALSVSVFAGTIYIKPDGTGDYPTIQNGINAAATDDIVLLAAGTYTGVGNRDIDFLGKAITVTSESGQDVTIIDCQQLGHGFVFQNGEGSSSMLSGVTIRNGTAQDYCGGGILCVGSSPTISGNTISGNSANDGGGISCVESSPTISGNTISGNSADHGGGIYCEVSSPTISGNTISGNSADFGGGISYVESSPTISGNTISGNSAHHGGGISCEVSSPTISGNTISGNSAGLGGGISCQESSPTISGNTISGNSAGLGGGISCEHSSPTISNTIIAFSTNGAGVYCFDSGSNPTLANCDIYGNAGEADFCGMDGGGNISADPLFCGILGSDNYYLRSDSPCAPGNHPSGTLIGAWPVGCGTISVEKTTWGNIKNMFK